ncbi:uncharacterized protein SOCE26_002340 [Sorangium cellulosum]|uniref:Uncharacterized protein n=1 Tax=Sorangium cellulosum TaxID=56 RepID=A0A2L0EHT6_SORCE|nr:uncharacterized protein SOCE26_002340 [Sorangium cellulosum]
MLASAASSEARVREKDLSTSSNGGRRGAPLREEVSAHPAARVRAREPLPGGLGRASPVPAGARVSGAPPEGTGLGCASRAAPPCSQGGLVQAVARKSMKARTRGASWRADG